MDADARAFLDELNAADAPGWSEMPPAEARDVFASFRAVFGRGPEVELVEDRDIAGVPCRVYVPDAAAGAIVYFHGGGWVLGDVETHDTMCRRLADAAAAAVVSVDYRRPPEHPFPAPLDDCVAVTQAVFTNAAGELPVGRVAVAGDSAGGNLAAGVVQRLAGSVDLAAAALLYPVLDASMSSDSYRQFATEHGLTAEAMAYFWDCYRSQPADDEDPAFNTMRADASTFPPMLVTRCGYDVLRDEAERFITKLRDANVPVTEVVHDDQIHGFMHFAAAVPAGKEALVQIGRTLRDLLDAPHN